MSAPTFNGCGFVRSGRSLYVGELPGLKSVCLYEIDGTVLRTLAFFRDHDDARRAMELLEALIQPTTHSPTERENT